jgi:hypothetical protein
MMARVAAPIYFDNEMVGVSLNIKHETEVNLRTCLYKEVLVHGYFFCILFIMACMINKILAKRYKLCPIVNMEEARTVVFSTS